MLWGLLMFLSFFATDLEAEVKPYVEDVPVIEETKDEVARVVKLLNGITLRFSSKTNKLMEFDYRKEGLSYGGYKVGDSLHNFGNFDYVNYHERRIFLSKKLEDNSVLRLTVENNIIVEITRFSSELTNA